MSEDREESIERLGQIYESGQEAPATGNYQLITEQRYNTVGQHVSRVEYFEEGELLPAHPETDEEVQWRFIRTS